MKVVINTNAEMLRTLAELPVDTDEELIHDAAIQAASWIRDKIIERFPSMQHEVDMEREFIAWNGGELYHDYSSNVIARKDVDKELSSYLDTMEDDYLTGVQEGLLEDDYFDV